MSCVLDSTHTHMPKRRPSGRRRRAKAGKKRRVALTSMEQFLGVVPAAVREERERRRKEQEKKEEEEAKVRENNTIRAAIATIDTKAHKMVWASYQTFLRTYVPPLTTAETLLGITKDTQLCVAQQDPGNECFGTLPWRKTRVATPRQLAAAAAARAARQLDGPYPVYIPGEVPGSLLVHGVLTRHPRTPQGRLMSRYLVPCARGILEPFAVPEHLPLSNIQPKHASEYYTHISNQFLALLSKAADAKVFAQKIKKLILRLRPLNIGCWCDPYEAHTTPTGTITCCYVHALRDVLGLWWDSVVRAVFPDEKPMLSHAAMHGATKLNQNLKSDLSYTSGIRCTVVDDAMLEADVYPKGGMGGDNDRMDVWRAAMQYASGSPTAYHMTKLVDSSPYVSAAGIVTLDRCVLARIALAARDPHTVLDAPHGGTWGLCIVCGTLFTDMGHPDMPPNFAARCYTEQPGCKVVSSLPRPRHSLLVNDARGCDIAFLPHAFICSCNRGLGADADADTPTLPRDLCVLVEDTFIPASAFREHTTTIDRARREAASDFQKKHQDVTPSVWQQPLARHLHVSKAFFRAEPSTPSPSPSAPSAPSPQSTDPAASTTASGPSTSTLLESIRKRTNALVPNVAPPPSRTWRIRKKNTRRKNRGGLTSWLSTAKPAPSPGKAAPSPPSSSKPTTAPQPSSSASNPSSRPSTPRVQPKTSGAGPPTTCPPPAPCVASSPPPPRSNSSSTAAKTQSPYFTTTTSASPTCTTRKSPTPSAPSSRPAATPPPSAPPTAL